MDQNLTGLRRNIEMNFSELSTTQIVLIVAALLVLGGIVVYLLQRRRTVQLRTKFGPEYERTLTESGDRRRAEASLTERAERVQSFHLRPLSSDDRARFVEHWAKVQVRFVDAPAGAVAEADQLLGDVMAMRGYPVGEFEQRAADISVDHPVMVENYRVAHEIALRHASGQATTEDLRRAMIHYRALFEDLVRDSAGVDRVGLDYAGFDQKKAPLTERAEYPSEPIVRARG
jgi:hypothetical protein